MPRSSSKTGILLPKGHGLRQLLDTDPCQPLLYAVEKVQGQAHYRRVARVLKTARRRKYEIGWLHVSDANQPCDRIIGARLLGYKLPELNVDERLQRIFDNSHFMHMRWQKYFLSLPPIFKVEVNAAFRQWPIVGEADVTVKHKHFGYVIVELKSMNSRRYTALKKVDPSHRQQVNMYVGLSGADSGQVWVESKDNQGVKTFWEPLDEDHYNGVMERVMEVYELMKGGRLPEGCGECGFDDLIADFTGVEERLAKVKVVQEKWQK